MMKKKKNRMAYRNSINSIKILIVMIFVIVSMSMTLTGCKKCVSVEYKDVPVKIIDAEKQEGYTYPIMVGKMAAMGQVLPSYETTVEYDSVEYSFSEEEIYYKYRDKIGKTTKGKLETRHYDDGSVEVQIVSLK